MNWATWAWNKLPFQAILERELLLGTRTTHHQDGITIYIDPAEGPFDAVYERIAAARRLLDRIDPARSRRVRTLLPRILVMKGVPTHFRPGTQTCCIERMFLDTASDALVACYLVHEAAHARLCRLGIDATPRSLARIEAVCIRDQIAFLQRLPRDEYPRTDRLIEWLASYAAAGLSSSR